MILVTGATGSIGGALLGQLKAAGANVRAGVRDPEKGESLEREGFDVVEADFADGEQLQKAMDGVDAVFLVSAQHPQQAELQNNVVDAAAEAGATRIVKVSAGSGVTGPDSPSWVGRAHWETEEHIKKSGVEHAFLRPNYFMKNLLMLADPIRAGTLPLPVHDQRTAMVDHRDVAAAAAAILTSDGTGDGPIHDLTGPESLPFSEVASRISSVLGREINYVDPPIDAAIENLRAKGAPDWLQEHMRQIVEAIREGKFADSANDFERLTGQAPRKVEDFVHDHKQLFE